MTAAPNLLVEIRDLLARHVEANAACQAHARSRAAGHDERLELSIELQQKLHLFDKRAILAALPAVILVLLVIPFNLARVT